MVVVLGIDFGTTSLKICILNEKKSVIYEDQERHGSEFEPGQQDAKKTVLMACEMIRKAQGKIDHPIVRITPAGQMHGVVLWNKEALTRGEFDVSPLYTWQFSCCDQETISLVSRQSPEQLFDGYGCATLAYLHKNNLIRDNWNVAGTIMDLFVAYITRSEEVHISSHNASSWGCFDGEKWTCADGDLFPTSLLPTVSPLGTTFPCEISPSAFPNEYHAEVALPIGDLQGSIYPFLARDTAVLNLGTSSQIVAMVEDGQYVKPETLKHLRVDPFYGDKKLLVAAGLNGGSALDAFIKNITNWTTAFSDHDQEPVNFGKLIEQVNEEARRTHLRKTTSLAFRPTYHGERGLPHLNGANICGLTPDTSLLEVLLALSVGVVDAIFDLLPIEYLKTLGVKNLHLTGSAAEPRYSARIKEICEEHGVGVIQGVEHMSAASGAALFSVET